MAHADTYGALLIVNAVMTDALAWVAGRASGSSIMQHEPRTMTKPCNAWGRASGQYLL
jgi:hypothetical protein